MALLVAFIKMEYKFPNNSYNNKDKLYCNQFLGFKIVIFSQDHLKIQILFYEHKISQKIIMKIMKIN